MHITRASIVPIGGLVAFILFLTCIPAANWLIQHAGTVCIPNGPCLIPVAPNLMAPSGVAQVGLALVLRDVVQRCLGKSASLIAIAIGTLLSALIAPPALVIASAAAFFLSEAVDFAVYTPLAQRRLIMAVIVSSMIGLVIDSVVFLSLAFQSLDYLTGQVVGKTWAVLISIPFIRLLRRAAPTPA